MLKYIFCLILFCTASVSAGEKLSCGQLDGMAANLDELAAAFEKAGSIEVGGEVDNLLADVINALYEVADIEKDATLDTYVADLESGWKKMDANNFAQALDDVIGSLDRLLKRDC